MENNTEENSQTSVKITKNNIIKVTIDTFLKSIDYEKKYKLNELKELLSDSFKSVKNKKKDNIKTKEPSKYNIYIKENMTKFKKQYPDMSNKEILKKAAEEWQIEKNK